MSNYVITDQQAKHMRSYFSLNSSYYCLLKLKVHHPPAIVAVGINLAENVLILFSLHSPAYEDGTDSEFRNVGN